MLVVTRISPQVKRDGYYNIYINDKYELSLSELDLASFQLKTNQPIDEKKLEELKKAYTKSKSYNFAIRYLALRPRSIKEVRDYLIIRKGFSDFEVDYTVERLVSENYLNDTDFAEMWVRNRILLSPKSNKVLRLELIKKGIDNSTIDSVLSDIGKDEQLDILNRLIEKKMRQSKYHDKQKLTEYLSRQGYAYDLIKQAMESLTFLKD
jgi:regulatory protein